LLGAVLVSAPSDKGSAKPAAFDVGWRERFAVLSTTTAIVLVIALIGERLVPVKAHEVFTLLPLTFVAIGKFLPLWGISDRSSLGPYELGTVIWALDTLTVVVFVYSFEAIYRIGPARRALDKIHHNMRLLLLAYPRIKQLSIVGVIMLVLFPVSGTGALAGTFIGLLLGVHRAVLIASVSAGGFLGGFLMAFLAANFSSALSAFQGSQETKYWLTGVFVALILGIVYWLSRAFQRVLEENEEKLNEG